MRGSFAQLKSRKTFSGAVVDQTMKKKFRSLGSVMFITLQDAIVQSVTLGVLSTGVPSVCSVEIFSSVLFNGRKEVVPISTQQYHDFKNLLIVKLFQLKIFFK